MDTLQSETNKNNEITSEWNSINQTNMSNLFKKAYNFNQSVNN